MADIDLEYQHKKRTLEAELASLKSQAEKNRRDIEYREARIRKNRQSLARSCATSSSATKASIMDIVKQDAREANSLKSMSRFFFLEIKAREKLLQELVTGYLLSEGGRFTGTIQTYNSEKGFGFIKEDRTEEDVFFHISRVIGSKSLNETPQTGKKAEFYVESDKKDANRVHAIKVRLL